MGISRDRSMIAGLALRGQSYRREPPNIIFDDGTPWNLVASDDAATALPDHAYFYCPESAVNRLKDANIVSDQEKPQYPLHKFITHRFMPGPMIASYAMGLVAPILMTVIDKVLEGEIVGAFAGMTGFDILMKAGVFPGDTLQVELEAGIKSKSSRGYLALDLRHITKNQRGEIVADLTEHVLFHPPSAA